MQVSFLVGYSMSLTLARLCGEWQLVSKIYGARSGKYEACIVIIGIPTADYFIAEYRNFKREIQSSDSDLSYICRRRWIFPRFLGKWKAVEENWKAVKEN
jgi:hypothetical protein